MAIKMGVKLIKVLSLIGSVSTALSLVSAPALAQVDETSLITRQMQSQYEALARHYIVSRSEAIAQGGFEFLLPDQQNVLKKYRHAMADSSVSNSERRELVGLLQDSADQIFARSHRLNDYSSRLELLRKRVASAANLHYLSEAEVKSLTPKISQLSLAVAGAAADLFIGNRERIELESQLSEINASLDQLVANDDGQIKPEDKLADDLHNRQVKVATRAVECAVNSKISVSKTADYRERQRSLIADVATELENGPLRIGMYGNFLTRLTRISLDLAAQGCR